MISTDTPSTPLAVDLRPVAQIQSGTLYLLLALALLLALVAIIWLTAFLFGRKASARRAKAPRHTDVLNRDEWRRRLHLITSQYQDGSFSKEEAFAQFSKITRDFASQRLGVNFATSTLREIKDSPHISAVQHFESLRQTIEALYPGEFAHPASASQGEAKVADAESWVNHLIEEWY